MAGVGREKSGERKVGSVAETESCRPSKESSGPPVTLGRLREEAGPPLYECTVCTSLWGGFLSSLARYSSLQTEKTSTQDNIPWAHSKKQFLVPA